MANCIYCGIELVDDVSAPEDADDEGKLLWRHPLMNCPVLGEITFQFPTKKEGETT